MKKLNDTGFGLHGAFALIFGIVGVCAIGFFAYSRFNSLPKYTYTTPKNQKYELKFVPNSSLIDSGELAKSLLSSLKPGHQILVEDKEFGLFIYISDYLSRSEPLTKVCTGKENFAFNIDNYEVCKGPAINGTTSMLLAKLGVDGKYFVAIIGHKYDGDRILNKKDSDYITEFRKINIMDQKDKVERIFRSIKPL